MIGEERSILVGEEQIDERLVVEGIEVVEDDRSGARRRIEPPRALLQLDGEDAVTPRAEIAGHPP